MYKHLIFDLYGTLIDLRTDEKQAELWHNLALFFQYNGAPYSSKELRVRYMETVRAQLSKLTHTKYPDIDLTHIFAILYNEKHVCADTSLLQHSLRLFRALSLDYLRLYDGVLELLQWLKEQDYKLYILSNGQREFSMPELRQLAIIDYFDGLYFSADYQVSKPDVAFMHVLLQQHQINIREALMIGNDHTTDLRVAQRCGMDSVYYHSNCSRKVKRVRATFQIWDGQWQAFRDWLILRNSGITH